MYEFPPSWWPPSNYSLSGLPVFLVVTVAGLLVVSIRVRGEDWHCVLRTAILVGLPPTMMLWQQQFVSRIYQPIRGPLVSILLLTLSLIALQAALRAVWKYRKSGHSWTSICRVVAGGVCCGLVIPVLCRPPEVSAAPEAAYRTQCKNNLKQIGLALHSYHDQQQMFPIAIQPQFDRSWRVTILPFMQQNELYEHYNQDETWDSLANAPLAEVRIPSFDCPGRLQRFDEQHRFLSAYAAVTGPGTAFGEDEYVRLNSFRDGQASTLMAVEACGTRMIWTQPQDISTETQKLQINAPGTQLHRSIGIMSSYHQGGAQALMADGSVRFISDQISETTLQRLTTRNGEPVGQEQLEFEF